MKNGSLSDPYCTTSSIICTSIVRLSNYTHGGIFCIQLRPKEIPRQFFSNLQTRIRNYFGFRDDFSDGFGDGFDKGIAEGFVEGFAYGFADGPVISLGFVGSDSCCESIWLQAPILCRPMPLRRASQ
jgi:hypothetical protein